MIRESLRRGIIRQRPSLVRAARGTVVALAALLVAVILGIENPYWAAMTALIVIQPTRGLLLEKSFYRLVGTVVGSVAGLLLLLSTKSPLVLTVALALWIATCVGIGNLLYGLRSYAFMMAACTCAVIAMSGYQNPHHIHEIAFGRIACIIVGIIVATGVTALCTPRQSRDELTNRLGRVAGETVGWLALLLRQGRESRLVRLEQDILIEIAVIEGMLDDATAGFPSFKKQKRQTRNLIAALLSLLAVGRLAREHLARHNELDRRHGQWRELLARHLEEVADKLESSSTVKCMTEVTAVVAAARTQLPLLGETLTDIVTSLQRVLADYGTMTDEPEMQPPNRLIHHRDWQEARRAAIRAALAIAAVGATWALTGWTKGPLMLMASSIMISIFSNKEHPAGFVGRIFIGAAIGSASAVFCRLLMLPGVTDPFMTAVIITPFILIGVFAMQHRRAAIAATDATLFFIFVAQPGIPIAVVPADLALGALAMVMGVGSAWLAYRYLVPINPAIRMRALLAAIARDIEGLAALAVPAAAETSRARMQHRVMRLVAMATRYDADHLAVVEGGLAALAIASCVHRLQEAQQNGNLPPSASGIIRETLLTLSDPGRRPHDVSAALEDAAIALYAVLEHDLEGHVPVGREDAGSLREGAGLFPGIAACLSDRSAQCPT
ncbi:MAG TPA: FUSC family protein [Geobacteraceae bacterium]